MTVRFFIEGEYYSPDQIREAQLVDDRQDKESSASEASRTDDAVESVIRLLSDMMIGKKPLLQARRSEAQYRFNYVGVVAAGGFLFPILPKYYTYDAENQIPSEQASAALVTVLAATRKYLATHPAQQDELHFNPSTAALPVVQNRLGLYRFLLEDYAQNGPYTNSLRIRELNGAGDIDWHRTINQITPIVSNGAPAYMELITTRRTRESSNFIARIQLAILNTISDFIEHTGLNSILHMPLVKQSRETLDNLGSTEMLVRRLQQELYVQFETRKRLLLSNMLNYFQDYNPADKNRVFAEGTGSFNLVWEDICKQIFRHDETIDMPRPQWDFFPTLEWHADGGKTHSVSDNDASEENASEELDSANANSNTLIPDVVNTDEKNHDPTIYILDAKYYMPTYNVDDKGKGHIAHQPGIGDIIKQYFYMMALQRGLNLGLGTNNSTETFLIIAGNAFILPAQRTLRAGDGPEPRYLLVQRGRVSLEFMAADTDENEGRRLPSHILLFELDAEQAIDMYLHAVPDKAVTLQYLRQMFEGQSETDSLKPKSIVAQPSAGKA